ncbi:MFS transporter [Aestuariivirga sp.]|jgi:PPP family 3-phenylpropionic acid transporter|uniref:MFS transporter n=1 Tax=Aestuariivirga sp. TaxID=2650926 RepID=UPI00378381AA
MSSRNFSLRLSLFNAALFLGTGIQLPFLPLWLKDRGLPDSEVALVVAMMMAVRIIAIPLGTLSADLTRRRRAVIIACAAGSFLAYGLMHVASGFWPILIAAMLAAALLAPVVPLSEVLAVEGSARYGLDYGRIRLWASLSFLAGSVLGGALLEIVPVGSVILLIAGAQGVGALFALLLPHDQAVRPVKAEPLRFGAALVVVSSLSFVLFLLAAGLGQASHGFLYAFGSVHYVDLGLSTFTIGKLWALGVLTEVLMFAFSNRFHRALGSVGLIVVGTGLATLRWTVTGLEPPLAILFAVQAMHAASFGFTHLGTMHFIRERVPENMRNTAQGLYSMLASGVLLSSTMWASGWLYGTFGGGAYFVMAGYAALAFVLALVLKAVSPRA